MNSTQIAIISINWKIENLRNEIETIRVAIKNLIEGIDVENATGTIVSYAQKMDEAATKLKVYIEQRDMLMGLTNSETNS